MSSNSEDKSKGSDYLDGQLLIAMPAMNDPNFEKTVIFLCAHSEQGAVGLVINRLVDDLSFSEILEQLDIVDAPRDDRPILLGGPVETERGFVLHSTDYTQDDATLITRETVGMTATLDVLRALAEGTGPEKSLLAIGYSGWAPGQLESEIQANGWLIADASEDILFDLDFDTKWDRAVRQLGIDPGFLTSEAGHA